MALDPLVKKTYQIRAPLATHWRSATCEEVGCEFFADGWRLRKELLTDRDIYTIGQIRHYVELDVADGETWLVFSPGTPCLKQWATGQLFTEGHHKLPVGRLGIYRLQPGDWRQYTSRPYVFDKADQWCDDFATHQDRLATIASRG